MFDRQDLIQAIFQGLPFVAALALGLLVPLAAVVTALVTRRVSVSWRMTLLLGSVVLGSTLTIALSGRVLYSEAEIAANPFLGRGAEGSPWGSLASQIMTIFALAICGGELLRWGTRQVKMNPGVRPVWIMAVIFFFVQTVASGVFGTFRNPRLNDLYGPTVLTTIALLAPGVDAAMWRRLRHVLLVPCAGSLIAMVAMPKLAVLTGYQSFIPGLSLRLFGLADHANSLGIIAAVGLVLELCVSVRMRPNLVYALIHLAVLILAQSKTAWVACLMATVLVRWAWIKESIFRGDAWRASLLLVVTGLFASSLLAVLLAAGFRSEALLATLSDSGVYTFTGRTEIWRVTLEEFHKSPLLGYGPSLWDLQFRYERGMLAAGQAHNQFIQILGQSGLLGLTAMLAYLLVMFRSAFVGRAWMQGFALVLLVLLFIRCLSESPLRMVSLMGWDNWLHYMAFAAVVSAIAHQEDAPSTPAPQRAPAREAT